MKLQSVHTFPKSHVHLSASVPVFVSCDRYSPESRVPDEVAHLPSYREVTDRIRPHGHDFFELGFVLRGRATHVTERGAQALRKGSVVIVPRGTVHSYESIEDMTLVNVFYIGVEKVKPSH